MKTGNEIFTYVGNELTIFAEARNWKAYWASRIEDYIGATILEVGAGIGATTRLMANESHNRWLGLEPDAEMYRSLIQQQQHNTYPSCVEFRCQTITDLGPGTLFDTILYIDVLEHIENDKEEIAMAAQHLLGGGHLIVLAPAYQFLYSPFDQQIGHFRRYNRQMLQNLTPPGLVSKATYYLDSVGVLASLLNVIFLRSPDPSLRQIKFWDRGMVPISRIVDKIVAFSFGRSVIQVWQRDPGPKPY